MTLIRDLLSAFCVITLSAVANAQVAPEIMWQHPIGGTLSEDGQAVLVLPDGSIVVAGSSGSSNGDVSSGNGQDDFWVVKLDGEGNILWENTLGGSSSDRAYDVIATNDGGFIAVGITLSGDGDVTGFHAGNDAWIVKLNGLGVLVWQRALGGAGADLFDAVLELPDGSIMVSGMTASTDGDVSFNHGSNDVWVVKLSSAGDLIWEKTYGGSGADSSRDIIRTSDGNLLVTASTRSVDGDVSALPGGGFSEGWVLKLDPAGIILWQRSVGGNSTDDLFHAKEGSDGSFNLTGWTVSTNIPGAGAPHGGRDFWAVKLNSTGTIAWQRYFGGTDWDTAMDLLVLGDRVVLFGHTESDDDDVSYNHAAGSPDYWLVGLDTAGTMLYNNSFGGYWYDEGAEIALSPIDSTLILVGRSVSSFGGDGDVSGHRGSSDIWVLKVSDKFASMTGTVIADLNSNGTQDALEPDLEHWRVNNSFTGVPVFTRADGSYRSNVFETGTSVLTPQGHPYYAAQPANHSVTITAIDNSIDPLNDFAMQPTVTVNDLAVQLTPIKFFRPGFAVAYEISYQNIGTTLLSPVINFFPDLTLTYDSCSLAPTTVGTDSITWQLSPLGPFQHGRIRVYLTLDENTVLGSNVYTSVRIDPTTGDADIFNNHASSTDNAQGSFDPNDILVDKPEVYVNDLTPDPPYLEYLIRFQNTGTDTAFTVSVENRIPANADFTSFQVVASSHAMTVEYRDYADALVFHFANILLPDSGTNMLGSNGFIRYRITPRSTLVVGNTVQNSASIFFDFNAPIHTGYVQTTIIASPLAVSCRALLSGPFDSSTGLQRDGLRTSGLIPIFEPYTQLGLAPTAATPRQILNPALLTITGSDAIVDWVLLELRSTTNNSTVVRRRAALLQRDGDIVDLDGRSPVKFRSTAGNYHLAVRHRNHLGIMSAAPFALTDNPTAVDFTNSTTPTHGTAARANVNGTMVLWSGDVNRDKLVMYTGALNDRDRVLVEIGGTVPTNTTEGYKLEDVNMDGVVMYTGANNDRDPLLVNIGGVAPTAVRTGQLP